MDDVSVLFHMKVLALLLSFSPLIVAFLHILVGLTWRADFLLGRLDTVLSLSRNEKRSVYCQVIELFNHVKAFATPRKFKEMSEIHRGLNEAIADPVSHMIYAGSNDWQTRRWSRVKLQVQRFQDSLRYYLPALFLCCVYLIGFQLILLRHQFAEPASASSQAVADNKPVPASTPTTNAPTAPATTPVASSSAAAATLPGISTNAKPTNTPPAPELSKQEESSSSACKSGSEKCPTASDHFMRWWKSIPAKDVAYLVYAFLGSFVFNTGIMVRRIFVWDISGQMFWWAAYRVVLSLGLAEVLNYTTPGIEPHMFFLIATASVSILDSAIRNLRAKLFQSDTVPKQSELSLQLVQGIDYWKEQRLLEEGIESIQNLATADFVLLALHTRTPLYTIMDWVDQAIFIQRFPSKASKLTEAGLPISAVKLTWGWLPENRDIPIRLAAPPPEKGDGADPNQQPTSWKYEEYLEQLSEALGTKEVALVRTLEAWTNDNQVQLLTLFWRADLGMGDKPT